MCVCVFAVKVQENGSGRLFDFGFSECRAGIGFSRHFELSLVGRFTPLVIIPTMRNGLFKIALNCIYYKFPHKNIDI